MTRSLPPALSPVSFRKLLLASLRSMRGRGGLRESLSSHLCSRFDCDTAIPTGSGTQALQLALRFSQGPEDKQRPVALPAYSCYDLISASVGSKSTILFYDLDPGTLSPDLDSMRAAVQGGARTVLVGNLYGFPLPWTGILDVCRDAGAVVVEDSAQGIGSSWGGRPGGTFGDMSVISFGRGKGWAGGGGGALLIRSEIAASSWRRVGLAPPPFGAGAESALTSSLQWLFGRPSLYWMPSMVPGLSLGETRFKVPRDLTDIPAFSAALAVLAAEDARRDVAVRRRNAERLQAVLSKWAALGRVRIPRPLAGGEAGFLRFPVLDIGGSDLLMRSRRARSLGIFRGYPRPLVDLSQGKSLHLAPRVGEFPGARLLAEHLVTFPTHRLVAERDFMGLSDLLMATEEPPAGLLNGHQP